MFKDIFNDCNTLMELQMKKTTVFAAINAEYMLRRDKIANEKKTEKAMTLKAVPIPYDQIPLNSYTYTNNISYNGPGSERNKVKMSEDGWKI